MFIAREQDCWKSGTILQFDHRSWGSQNIRAHGEKSKSWKKEIPAQIFNLLSNINRTIGESFWFFIQHFHVGKNKFNNILMFGKNLVILKTVNFIVILKISTFSLERCCLFCYSFYLFYLLRKILYHELAKCCVIKFSTLNKQRNCT